MESEAFDLHRVLSQQNQYLKRQYTAEENGRAAREERDILNAQKAIESEKGFLSLTLKEKIQEIMIPEKVLKEFADVAINAVTSTAEPFFTWLKENEIYYTENLFEKEVQSGAKQLYFTKWALTNEAAEGALGQQFVADF